MLASVVTTAAAVGWARKKMPKEPQPKRNVYVGGLEEQVNEEILHAAFVPFGDIVEVSTAVRYWYCLQIATDCVYEYSMFAFTRATGSKGPGRTPRLVHTWYLIRSTL